MNAEYAHVAAYWDANAQKEEDWLSRPSINRALRWREIERHLSGVRSICDVGAGTGAFSIPLARRGFQVTHLDLSPAMLAIARTKAEDLANLKLIEANAADLSRFADRGFDLVLNMDGAIAGCGDDLSRVISESCRISDRTLILSTAHRGWMIAESIAKGFNADGELPANLSAIRSDGLGFLPPDLARQVQQYGFDILRAGAVGSLAALCPPQLIESIAAREELFNRFIELCQQFDAEVLPQGPGTPDDTGLLLVARRN